MASKEAREAAIKKASQQVRAGGVFSRASAASKVSPDPQIEAVAGALSEYDGYHWPSPSATHYMGEEWIARCSRYREMAAVALSAADGTAPA